VTGGARATRRELWLVTLILTVVSVAIYGPHVLDGGFTIDDWSHAAAVQYPRESILADYWSTTSLRHGLVVYIPLTHVVLGPHPAAHIALAIVMAILMSTALFALLRRLAFTQLQAGAIALLVLLFPWSDTARFWAVAGHISLVIALGIAGVLLALRGLDARAEGRPRRGLALHAGALALYALSILTYDIAGAALLLAGALYLTRAPRRVACLRWAADVAVIVPCLALSWLRADRAQFSLSEMADHADAIADGGATILALAAFPFGSPSRQAVLTVLFTVVVVAVVVRRLLPSSDDARPALGRWIAITGAGALLAAASWAQYIPADPYYNPVAAGSGNRVNVMAAVGVVIALYGVATLAATLALRGTANWTRVASLATAAFAAVLAVGYARDTREDQRAWARAATSADAVLATIEKTVPNPRPDSTIYTFGHPGGEAPGISIFGYQWDLRDAVRLRYDRPDLDAYPILEGVGISCLKPGLGPTGSGWSPALQGTRYGTAYFVDVASSTMDRIDSRRECSAVLSKYVPGPGVRVQ
jgi:hypothetical protein